MARPDLYFIRNSALGIIKIGIARDVARRRRSLELSSGVRLEVLRVEPNGAPFEKPLHEAFHESRLVGEWFTPTPDLLGLIDGRETPAAFLQRVRPNLLARDRAIREALAAEQGAREAREAAAVAAVAARQRDMLRIAREDQQAKEERSRIDAEQLAWREGRVGRDLLVRGGRR